MQRPRLVPSVFASASLRFQTPVLFTQFCSAGSCPVGFLRSPRQHCLIGFPPVLSVPLPIRLFVSQLVSSRLIAIASSPPSFPEPPFCLRSFTLRTISRLSSPIDSKKSQRKKSFSHSLPEQMASRKKEAAKQEPASVGNEAITCNLFRTCVPHTTY